MPAVTSNDHIIDTLVYQPTVRMQSEDASSMGLHIITIDMPAMLQQVHRQLQPEKASHCTGTGGLTCNPALSQGHILYSNYT